VNLEAHGSARMRFGADAGIPIVNEARAEYAKLQ